MVRYFAVFATDKPGMRAVRDRVRPAHRGYMRTALQRGVFVRLGGPMLEPRSGVMNGTLLVIEAEALDDVVAFVNNDPYMAAGLFDRVEIRPWGWSLGNPEWKG